MLSSYNGVYRMVQPTSQIIMDNNFKSKFYVSKTWNRLQYQHYKLFVEKKGIPAEKLIECYEELRQQLGISKRRHLLAQMKDKFPDLLKLVSEKTNVSFKQRPETDHYNDWYQEASFDGSLAYNGVADDF